MTPPPIASPHSYEPYSLSKPPFRGLKIFVVLNLVFLFLPPLTALYSPHKSLTIAVGVYAVYIFLGGLLFWRLWHGSNMARILFCLIIGSLIVSSFLRHPTPRVFPSYIHVLNFLYGALIIGGLIWLQLPSVKAHFRRGKSV